MNFFILASKSSSLLSSILCKLGMDPNFQLFLSSNVQGDTCRGYGQWVMQSREGNPSAGALWKGHPGRQLLPSLVWGSGERRKYRSGARTGLCVQVFSIWNPSQCVHSVSNGKHTSIEEGFYTVCLHLEVAVIRYNNEVKKKREKLMEDTCWLKSELFPYLKRVLLKISIQGIMLPETAWLRKYFYDFFSVLTIPKLFLVLQLAAGCVCSGGESRRSQQWRLNSLVTLSSIVFQDI